MGFPMPRNLTDSETALVHAGNAYVSRGTKPTNKHLNAIISKIKVNMHRNSGIPPTDTQVKAELQFHLAMITASPDRRWKPCKLDGRPCEADVCAYYLNVWTGEIHMRPAATAPPPRPHAAVSSMSTTKPPPPHVAVSSMFTTKDNAAYQNALSRVRDSVGFSKLVAPPSTGEASIILGGCIDANGDGACFFHSIRIAHANSTSITSVGVDFSSWYNNLRDAYRAARDGHYRNLTVPQSAGVAHLFDSFRDALSHMPRFPETVAAARQWVGRDPALLSAITQFAAIVLTIPGLVACDITRGAGIPLMYCAINCAYGSDQDRWCILTNNTHFRAARIKTRSELEETGQLGAVKALADRYIETELVRLCSHIGTAREHPGFAIWWTQLGCNVGDDMGAFIRGRSPSELTLIAVALVRASEYIHVHDAFTTTAAPRPGGAAAGGAAAGGAAAGGAAADDAELQTALENGIIYDEPPDAELQTALENGIIYDKPPDAELQTALENGIIYDAELQTALENGIIYDEPPDAEFQRALEMSLNYDEEAAQVQLALQNSLASKSSFVDNATIGPRA